MKPKQVTPLLCAGLALVALGFAGCTDARSEPLEVTYYYLPG